LRRRQDAQQPGTAQARARAARGREAEAGRVRCHHRARPRRGRRAGEAAAMTITIVWLAIALAGCLVVQAFFAASEIALVSADDLKVRAGSESGHARSRVLAELLSNRDRLLALTLTGTNVATVVAAVVLTSFLHQSGRPHLVYLAPFILTPITLVIGESIPKLITLTNPHAFALRAARPPPQSNRTTPSCPSSSR